MEGVRAFALWDESDFSSERVAHRRYDIFVNNFCLKMIPCFHKSYWQILTKYVWIVRKEIMNQKVVAFVISSKSLQKVHCFSEFSTLQSSSQSSNNQYFWQHLFTSYEDLVVYSKGRYVYHISQRVFDS